MIPKIKNLILQEFDKAKFIQYRTKIFQKFKLDIKDSSINQNIAGGLAKNMKIWEITKYPLDQILLGIQTQLQHSPDTSIALQIALDHLSQHQDYYTVLKNNSL